MSKRNKKSSLNNNLGGNQIVYIDDENEATANIETYNVMWHTFAGMGTTTFIRISNRTDLSLPGKRQGFRLFRTIIILNP